MKLLLITIAAVVLVGCGASVTDISIHRAAYDGNIEAVKQHLAAGTDVNVKNEDDNGMTPLHYAAFFSHRQIAELLIATGADVNAKEEDGMTPLHVAAHKGHKEIAELLIATGADVNAKNGDGTEPASTLMTPLHAAAFNGYKEIAELLIEKGADVNIIISSGPLMGQSALDFASVLKSTETADLLRKHGGKTSEELKAAGN